MCFIIVCKVLNTSRVCVFLLKDELPVQQTRAAAASLSVYATGAAAGRSEEVSTGTTGSTTTGCKAKYYSGLRCGRCWLGLNITMCVYLGSADFVEGDKDGCLQEPAQGHVTVKRP